MPIRRRIHDQAADRRGEFIATQLARSALKTRAGAKALLAREDEALKKHKKKWIAFAAAKGSRWEFRDGFAEKVSLDAADLIRAGVAIFATEPVVELSVWKIDALAPVLALPGLAQVRHLSLARKRFSADDIAALVSAPHLGAVEVLGDAGARVLAASERLPKLASLVLTHNSITDNVLPELLASTVLARLEHLDLAGNLSDHGILQLRERLGKALRWDGRG